MYVTDTSNWGFDVTYVKGRRALLLECNIRAHIIRVSAINTRVCVPGLPVSTVINRLVNSCIWLESFCETRVHKCLSPSSVLRHFSTMQSTSHPTFWRHVLTMSLQLCFVLSNCLFFSGTRSYLVTQHTNRRMLSVCFTWSLRKTRSDHQIYFKTHLKKKFPRFLRFLIIFVRCWII